MTDNYRAASDYIRELTESVMCCVTPQDYNTLIHKLRLLELQAAACAEHVKTMRQYAEGANEQ